MIDLFSGLWLKVKLWAIGAAAALAFIGAIYLKGRSAGKEVERTKNRKDLEKNVEKDKRLSNDLDSLTDAELRKRLSDDWELPSK